jgi:hypothetical protein
VSEPALRVTDCARPPDPAPKDMRIKKSSPKHRKSFRARHHCDTNPGPKWKGPLHAQFPQLWCSHSPQRATGRARSGSHSLQI